MPYIGSAPGLSTQRIVTTFTASGGQTVFTPNGGYPLGYVDVYYNGVKLVAGDDYTATNGGTVTLTAAAAAGDAVEIVAFFPRGLSDGYTKAEADARYLGIAATVTTAINVSGGTASVTTLAYSGTLTGGTGIINIGSGQLYKDASGNIGIGTSSPGAPVEINNGSGAYIRLTPGSESTILANGSNSLTLDASGSPSPLLRFRVGGGQRLVINSDGAIGIGAGSYGSSGQVLTSNGVGSPPSWSTPSGMPQMIVVSTASSTSIKDRHYVLTGASATTLTLPGTPAAGDVVWVTVANGRTDNVIARNGRNIQSVAEDMTLNSAYAAVQLRYIDATRGWVIT